MDTLDLVQVHAPDPTTPIAETLGALRDAKVAGKLRAIGVSNFSVDQVRAAEEALDDVPLASVQSLYNALEREIETELVPYAREHGIGVLAYSPLDQGLLTGSVGAERTFPRSDARHRRPSFTPENRALVNGVLERVVAPVARRHAGSIAQVMLAWTLAQPGIGVVLAGARDPRQARENARAQSIALTDGERAAIRAAFEELRLAPRPVTVGERVRGLCHRLRFGR